MLVHSGGNQGVVLGVGVFLDVGSQAAQSLEVRLHGIEGSAHFLEAVLGLIDGCRLQITVKGGKRHATVLEDKLCDLIELFIHLVVELLELGMGGKEGMERPVIGVKYTISKLFPHKEQSREMKGAKGNPKES